VKAAALALLLVAACRDMDPEITPDAAIDAPDTACDPRTPRTVEPQVFVGPSGLEPRLDGLIDAAERSIDVQMYLFNDTVIASHLISAKQRGVAVRAIFDRQEGGNETVRGQLMAAGIEVLSSSEIYSYAHAKYLLIDGQRAVIMSMNFNTDAMTHERNYGIVDDDPQDVADVAGIFTADWALANGQHAAANLDCTRLIVSPTNAELRLQQLVASATSTLDVAALYIVDTGMRNAIGLAASRGVSVRVILETPDDQDGNDVTASYFQARGIPVHYATDAQFYLHAKLIVADGVAFVGSQNYSTSGLTLNREVGALVFEPDQAAIIHAQFESDWAATLTVP
jgi:phosphatidylserine/phosphatidylglycerophosphate/cardiolipin synthase-like enzyme